MKTIHCKYLPKVPKNPKEAQKQESLDINKNWFGRTVFQNIDIKQKKSKVIEKTVEEGQKEDTIGF